MQPFIGVPMDIGTSHRSGTRFGPRQIRAESAMPAALQHVDQSRSF